MVTDRAEFIVGVDTHADRHALAVVDATTQRTCRELTVAASRQGYRQALRLAKRHAPGRRAWALEGSGCYGAGLARFLNAQGELVLEVERPAREGQNGRLKTDALDAERAARQLLAGTAGALPRLAPDTQALRALLTTREGAVTSCTAALNELRALIIISPPKLRERLQGQSEAALLDACLRLRSGNGDSQRAAVALALRSLALRIRQLRSEAKTLEKELARRTQTLAPELLAQPGVGPITAAAVLIAWSHPGRLRSEAAFARLAGTAPIPASSGKTIRHRLDRGGDRQLNRALHTIILTRRRIDPQTKAYIARRVSQGKSEREATRCLKRYLARDSQRAAVALALRSLALRIRQLRSEAKTLEKELARRTQTLAPELLAQPGVGPITAAAVLIAWSHPGRLRSEAAFARLAGTAPIPASSGKTIRHRLDRGGDRQLNRALHTIILTRRRIDPQTKAYIARRVSQGKSEREATRCLKRYLARSLFRHLEAMPPT
mgnify:CR=1 FL=1